MLLRTAKRIFRLLALSSSGASKLLMLSLLLLNISLASLTMAVVVSDRMFDLVSSAAPKVGASTVKERHKRQVGDLRRGVRFERENTARIQTELDEARRADGEAKQRAGLLQSDLDQERQRSRELQARASTLDAEVQAQRAKFERFEANIRRREAADAEAYRELASRFRSRAQRMAGANIAATGGEAIPFYGVAVIVAATGYELAETCAMMQDMDALASRLRLEPADAATEKVCGMEVPTSEEVWTAVTGAPRAAWEMARENIPTEVPAPPSIDWSWLSAWLEWLGRWLPGQA